MNYLTIERRSDLNFNKYLPQCLHEGIRCHRGVLIRPTPLKVNGILTLRYRVFNHCQNLVCTTFPNVSASTAFILNCLVPTAC